MIKGMGCLLTVAGCIGLGLWYRQQFTERLHHIRILLNILDMMMSQVRYHKAMLPECCHYLSQRLEEPYKSAFSSLQDTFCRDTGENYGKLFYGEMAKCFDKVVLGKEEKTIFLEFTKSCGYEDAGLQINSMEQYRERLKQLLNRLEEEVAGKGRMAMGLSVLGGLLLIVILL